jgi:hypothetical protein
MRVVPAARAVEVLPVAAWIARWPEAFVASPRVDQRAVDRDMLVRQQWRDVRMMQQRFHEASEQIAVLQSLTILRQRRRIPHRVVRRTPDEPAGQQMVVQLLHQVPLTPYAVAYWQEQRAQQLFGRDRWTPRRGIQCADIAVQLTEHLAHQLASSPERVSCRDPLFRREIRQ